jgi:F-type H+-transporting ATPase subunit b
VDSGVLLKDFLYRCLKFGVAFGLLAYFVTKPIRKGLAGRREGIAKALADADTAKAEAEAKFAEYDRKLSKAAAEIEENQSALRREGELERERILASAREMSEKIKQEAEKSAANEVAKARAELRQEAARMAISIAEDLLKQNFTGADQDRLVSEYLQKVGELH